MPTRGSMMDSTTEIQGSTQDPLLARADVTIEEARRLRFDLMQQVSQAQFICRLARQSQVLHSGLAPALSISLMVAQRLRRPRAPRNK